MSRRQGHALLRARELAASRAHQHRAEQEQIAAQVRARRAVHRASTPVRPTPTVDHVQAGDREIMREVRRIGQRAVREHQSICPGLPAPYQRLAAGTCTCGELETFSCPHCHLPVLFWRVQADGEPCQHVRDAVTVTRARKELGLPIRWLPDAKTIDEKIQ